jgi:hypothetical protein
MDYLQMTAPCGLDCFNCPLYAANDNHLLKIAIAKKLNIPTAKVVCQGCRNEKGNPPCHKMKTACKVYRCIEQKGYDFCFECEDFPCDHLHPYADQATEVPHNTKMFNLCLIKKMGLEPWAKEKAKSVKDTYFKDKWKI